MTDAPRNGEGSRDTGLGKRVEAFLGRIVHETGVPGIAVAAHVRGQPLHCSAGHAARPGERLGVEHRFHVGCTVKLLLAAVALELADRRRLDLTAPLGDALPELHGTVHGATIRVHHLLSHTSGYRGTRLLDPRMRDIEWRSFIDALRAAPQLFAPGTVFSYEHTESVLLGAVLRRATGTAPLKLVRRFVLEPLGIVPGALAVAEQDPRWAGRHELDPATGRFAAAQKPPALSPFWSPAFSDFTLSIADLAAITDALLPTAPAGRDPSPLSAAAREHLTRAVVRLPPCFGGPLRERLPCGFGLGAAAFHGAVHGHNGLTYGQCVGLRYMPSKRIAVAVGMNAVLPHLRDLVIDTLCAELAGQPLGRPDPVLDFELAELEGVYIGPGDAGVEASLDGDRLVIEIGRAPHRFSADLRVDGAGKPLVRSPLPQLSVGFFRTGVGELGLTLGVSAYKRVAPRAHSAADSTAGHTERAAASAANGAYR